MILKVIYLQKKLYWKNKTSKEWYFSKKRTKCGLVSKIVHESIQAAVFSRPYSSFIVRVNDRETAECRGYFNSLAALITIIRHAVTKHRLSNSVRLETRYSAPWTRWYHLLCLNVEVFQIASQRGNDSCGGLDGGWRWIFPMWMLENELMLLFDCEEYENSLKIACFFG